MISLAVAPMKLGDAFPAWLDASSAAHPNGWLRLARCRHFSILSFLQTPNQKPQKRGKGGEKREDREVRATPRAATTVRVAAEEGVEQARERIAKLIGATAKEIIFTSGATESNNLAIKGVAEMYREKGNHVITQVIEHKAVLDNLQSAWENKATASPIFLFQRTG